MKASLRSTEGLRGASDAGVKRPVRNLELAGGGIGSSAGTDRAKWLLGLLAQSFVVCCMDSSDQWCCPLGSLALSMGSKSARDQALTAVLDSNAKLRDQGLVMALVAQAAHVVAKLRFDRLEDVARLVQGFTGGSMKTLVLVNRPNTHRQVHLGLCPLAWATARVALHARTRLAGLRKNVVMAPARKKL